MRIRESQMRDLLRGIVREVMNELSSTQSQDISAMPQDSVPIDKISPAAQAKLDRDKRREVDLQIKQNKMKLQSARDKMKSDNNLVDKAKLIDIPQIRKDLSDLEKQKRTS